MKVKIESGIPIPAVKKTARNAAKSRPRFDFGIMNDGDSFAVPLTPSARHNVHRRARHQGYKIVTRPEGDRLRVWLVGRPAPNRHKPEAGSRRAAENLYLGGSVTQV